MTSAAALFGEGADHGYDFREAFGVVDEKSWINENGKIPAVPWEDVAEVLAHNISFGDYAETEVWLLGKLKDGRFIYLNSSCDTTGWDCQAGGHAYVSADFEKVSTFGMTIEERLELESLSRRCLTHADCLEKVDDRYLLAEECFRSRELPSNGTSDEEKHGS